MGINDYGFAEAGEWELNERLKSKITFKLHSLEDARVIYAFVVGEEVKYVGICDVSTTTLRERMKRYKGLQGASTNKRIAEKIKDCLREGKAVRIFALKPEVHYQYEGLDVDLIKGLEKPLVEKLKPEWNIHS